MARATMFHTFFTSALLLWLATSAGAQGLASDADRREAFRHYRSGQEFLSGEQYKKPRMRFVSRSSTIRS